MTSQIDLKAKAGQWDFHEEDEEKARSNKRFALFLREYVASEVVIAQVLLGIKDHLEAQITGLPR